MKKIFMLILVGLMVLTLSILPAMAEEVSLGSETINIDSADVFNLTLTSPTGEWQIEDGTDVTSWFVNEAGEQAFADAEGVATASVAEDGTLSVEIDASNITGFTESGIVDLYVAASEDAIGEEVGLCYVGTYEIPTLTIDSDLFGSFFNGLDIDFGDTSAVLTLTLDGLDDDAIGMSDAYIALEEGDGYYSAEFSFTGALAEDAWENGEMSYTMESGDLNYASGAEWTTLGGDGQGLFVFNFSVNGITYNGLPVESETFRVQIYCYGRDFTLDAIDLYGEEQVAVTAEQKSLEIEVTVEDEPVWTWVGEDGYDSDVPILCDDQTDNFYISWPEGTDNSALTADDVVLTMTSQYGDTKVLTPEEDYAVFFEDGVTQIAVTYQNLAFIPVYTELEIVVTTADAEISTVYDIASVYVYYTMFGGNGDVRGWAFYGFDLDTWTSPYQLLKPVLYTLKLADDEQELYYSETEGLVESEEDATVYDGTEARAVSLNANFLSVYRITDANFPMYEEIEIDGTVYTFELVFNGDDAATPGTMLYNPTTLLTEHAEDTTYYPIDEYPIPDTLPGYAIAWGDNGWITMEKWAWMSSIDIGWKTIDVQCESTEIVYTSKTPSISLVKGTSEQFYTPALEDDEVTWVIDGTDLTGITIDENGLLSIAEDTTASSVTVYAMTDEDYGIGAVTVNLTDPEDE